MSVSPASMLAHFDPASQKELLEFIENEQKRSVFQRTVHGYTETCFDKCITKVRKSMDSSEQACLTNCVERFLDTSIQVVQAFQKSAGK